MPQSERLPWRLERPLALETPGYLEVVSGLEVLPRLRCSLTSPARSNLSFVVRILSRSGIPLAHASVALRSGDCSFDTPVALIAMEGYRHLSQRARHDVESRVWSRRAYAIASAA